jgi:hypothetical protein
VEHHLESEFRLFQRRRDVVGRNAEARLGNVRFLGELVKFRLIPFGAVLSRLKVRLGPCSAVYACRTTRRLFNVLSSEQHCTPMPLNATPPRYCSA